MVIKVHRKLKKVIEGHGRYFPNTRLTFQIRNVIWVGVWVVACIRNIVSVPVPFLWTLDFRLLTLDLGLRDLKKYLFRFTLTDTECNMKERFICEQDPQR